MRYTHSQLLHKLCLTDVSDTHTHTIATYTHHCVHSVALTSPLTSPAPSRLATFSLQFRYFQYKFLSFLFRCSTCSYMQCMLCYRTFLCNDIVASERAPESWRSGKGVRFRIRACSFLLPTLLPRIISLTLGDRS